MKEEGDREGARAGGPQHCCLQTCVETLKEGRLPSRAEGVSHGGGGLVDSVFFQGSLKPVRLVTQHWLQV